MSNSQFSLTIKAREIIEEVPKRARSKFVSDAIVHYIKKKGILDDYIVQKQPTKLAKKNEPSTSANTIMPAETAKNNVANEQPAPVKKIKVDKDF